MTHPELSRHCIPWTPFSGNLKDAQICLVSSAGIRLREDEPFNTDGDVTYRTIPAEATGSALAYDDTHYDHGGVDADINCVFPVDRLRELTGEGYIAGPTEHHFSYGFSMKLKELRETTFPSMLQQIEKVRPDAVVLTGG